MKFKKWNKKTPYTLNWEKTLDMSAPPNMNALEVSMYIINKIKII